MRVTPGLTFSLVCDLGFAVGLVTHQVPRFGDLVWMADPIFDEAPDIEVARRIERWRWPVFFPTGAALRRRVVEPVGVVQVPHQLQAFPRLRGGNRDMGWRETEFIDGTWRTFGVARDSSIPISQAVNDTALKEYLVSKWKPEDTW